MFLALAFLLMQAFPVLAASRVALVIGNSSYQNVPALPNPVNDANDISAALKRLGFSVKTLLNAKKADMDLALKEFRLDARGAEMAAIFFAGHGMPYADDNWLIPVDAEVKSEVTLQDEAVSQSRLMTAVSDATRLGLVILDACRRNPFQNKMKTGSATRDAYRGFVRANPTNNVQVAYATREGTVAQDGNNSRNSPYTRALLDNLEKPGLEIRLLFGAVRDDVMTVTGGEQQPIDYSSLGKQPIYLKPAADVPGTPITEEMIWNAARSTKASALFQLYLGSFPNGAHAQEARKQIDEIAVMTRPAGVGLQSGSKKDVSAIAPPKNASPPAPGPAVSRPEPGQQRADNLAKMRAKVVTGN